MMHQLSREREEGKSFSFRKIQLSASRKTSLWYVKVCTVHNERFCRSEWRLRSLKHHRNHFLCVDEKKRASENQDLSLSIFECQCYEKWTCSTGISVASTFVFLLSSAAGGESERKKRRECDEQFVRFASGVHNAPVWRYISTYKRQFVNWFASDYEFSWCLFLLNFTESCSRAVNERERDGKDILEAFPILSSVPTISLLINEFFVWFIARKRNRHKKHMPREWISTLRKIKKTVSMSSIEINAFLVD